MSSNEDLLHIPKFLRRKSKGIKAILAESKERAKRKKLHRGSFLTMPSFKGLRSPSFGNLSVAKPDSVYDPFRIEISAPSKRIRVRLNGWCPERKRKRVRL